MDATTLAVEVKTIEQPKPLPVPNIDSYHFGEVLPADELSFVKKVRTYMKAAVALIIKWWASSSFELLPLLDFTGSLFLFPTSAPVLTSFSESRRSHERNGEQ